MMIHEMEGRKLSRVRYLKHQDLLKQLKDSQTAKEQTEQRLQKQELWL